MTTDKESQIANLELWIAALRSGEYKQARGHLRRGDSFCCLGVACDVLYPIGWDGFGGFNVEGLNACFSLPDPMRNALGLSESAQDDLIVMNDADGASFLKVADYIEKTVLAPLKEPSK